MATVNLSVNVGENKRITFHSGGTYNPEDIVFDVSANGSGYKPLQTAVSDPTASSTTSTTFIDSISQNANGVITATKKTLPSYASSNHSHAFSSITSRGEAYLEWGGQNLSGTYAPIDAAMVGLLGANRTAFVSPSAVTVEYSRDGGTTWKDYGASNSDKTGFFTDFHNSGFYIGKSTASNPANANCQLRVTLSTSGSVYTVLNKFVIYVSTSGSSGTWCSIDARLQSNVTNNTNTWTNFANKIGISGWSGYNVINTSGIVTYGNTASSQYGQVRFTFGCTSSSTSYPGLLVYGVNCYGGVGWTTPSTMARSGELYTFDMSQNATFPASITATKFVKRDGTSSQFLKADGSVDSNSYSLSSHTHATTIAASSGTNQITLAFGTKYAITAGGTSYVFTMPSNPNTNTTYTIATGDEKGQIKVTPSSGSAYNVDVKGLGSAAYTESSAYATSGHTHTTTIAAGASGDTNQLTLAASTKYKLTSGGSTFVFTTPPDHTYNFSGVSFTSTNSTATDKNANNLTGNGTYYYSSNGPATSLGASTDDGGLYVQSYSSSWVGQIAQDYRNGRLFVRGKNNGTWSPWKRVANYDEIATSGHNHDSTYLKLSGGQMVGNISWKDGTALPQQTSPKYILCIDAFSEGGATKWADISSLKTELGTMPPSSHTHTTSIAASTGTNQITLAHGSKYAITAGGTSYVFTMPAQYSHPSYTATTAGAYKIGNDATGHVVIGAALAKGDVGLGNVENKSSATIRSEITSSNVTTALGFTPASNSHQHSYIITAGDNRAVATKPNDYSNRIVFQGLKSNSTIGNPSGSSYSYVIGLRGWSDSSGGNAHEMAFNDNGLYLRNGETTEWKGWERVLITSDIGSSVAAYNHTHSTTIAASSGTNQLTLAFGGKYAITAGGTSYVFTMPANPDTDVKVKQTAHTTTDATEYPIITTTTASPTSGTAYEAKYATQAAVTGSGDIVLKKSSSKCKLQFDNSLNCLNFIFE